MEPVPRPLTGETLLTDTERQARYRAARAARPWVIRTPHPANHRSRAQCWHEILAALVALQAAYVAWLETFAGEPARQRHR